MFRLYGNLFLERPEQHLDEGQLAGLTKVMAAIQSLENRTAITREEDYNLEDNFDEFKARETLAWRELGVARPPEFLIPPAGSLDAPVACHLHNPTFHVEDPYKAITEDPSSPTIYQLTQAGFSSGNCFLFDHVSRRDETEIYLSFYPDKVRHIHENFALELRRQMKAVVEICWGKSVRKRMLECVDLVPLPLWGEYKDVTLHLEYENGQLDLLLTVAARLGGITYHTGLYEHQHNPGAYGRLRAEQRATKEHLIAEKYAPEIERTVAPVTANTTAQGGFPEVISYDTDMRRLNDTFSDLNLALRTECSLPSTIPTDLALQYSELTSIAEFDLLPEALTSWIQSQEGLKIQGKPISTNDELVLSFRLLHRFGEAQIPGSVILIAYSVAEAYIYNVCKTRKSSIQDLIGPPTDPHRRIMHLNCRKCAKRVHDTWFAYYARRDPDVYVCQTLEAGCGRLECSGRTALIPANPWQKHIMARRGELENAPKDTGGAWAGYIIRSRTESQDLPDVVKIACLGCKQNQVETTQIDVRPRWTIERIPRYLAPRRRCSVCKQLKYWRPVSQTIAIIDTPTIAHIWGKMKKEGLDYNEYPRLPGLFFANMPVEDKIKAFKKAKRDRNNKGTD
ncbi:hypothetical protein BJX68DRAFT_260407 [Aspergillus pseudodeflectus]|uniref:Uncharacterized protein n=1 Tax=Aspergillus pseudodeflectus TaxID=176178 RepID=A0ABR4LAN7_9EURO